MQTDCSSLAILLPLDCLCSTSSAEKSTVFDAFSCASARGLVEMAFSQVRGVGVASGCISFWLTKVGGPNLHGNFSKAGAVFSQPSMRLAMISCCVKF